MIDLSNRTQYAYYNGIDSETQIKLIMNDKLDTYWLASSIKLSFNVTKTNYMNTPLTLGNSIIDKVNVTKLLCIYIDENLRWNEHAHKVSKINQIILHYE